MWWVFEGADLRNVYRAGLIGFVALAAAPAEAGDVPLYQAAPAWVVAAPLPDGAAAAAADAPAMILYDVQQRMEDGRLWSYADSATRISSPEMLAQFSTLTLPWMPDKGDLIVHEVSILRDGKRIDLLGQGQKFTVLRREQSLEQRELTGILTATLALEGLQVGDVVRIRLTTTARDEALGGRVQTLAPLPAEPLRIGLARMLYSWPAASAPRWKVHAEGVKAAPVRKGDYTELSLTLPAPKQPEMPDDAPLRYRHPPLIEISTFADWADVSKVMAPLYATDGAIAPGSPLAAEVAAIVKAEASPLGRAQRALELVQDKVRYLMVGMDGGNYVPQKPARTWEVRYGDCKAKTLLLLAMLQAMDIEAEPVLAHTALGDFVAERLPSAAAFNHVLVRATIGGESLWLDGTGAGARLADIHDTPAFRHVLPIRAAGAGLMAVATHVNARPVVDLAIDSDESASPDLPTVFDATATVRGQPAAMLTLANAQLGEKEKRETIAQFFQSMLGEAQFSTATMTPDPAAGIVTLTAHGVATTRWTTEDRKRKRSLARAFEGLNFAPDRARPAWKAIPVAVPDPDGMRFRLRLRLPDGGRGYTMEGEPDLKARLAGYDLTRTLRVAGDVLTLDERIDSTGGEIPAGQNAAERDRIATAKARAPRLVAPDSAPRRWDLTDADRARSSQIKGVEAVFEKAIAADPEEASGYVSRANFRKGLGDRRGALADLGRAIAIEPTVDLHLERAAIAWELGDFAAAAADAEAARALDPSSTDATERVAWLKAERGDLAGALALIDERIALGGDTSQAYRAAKATLVGEFGDPAEAVKLFDALISDKPGSPSLLNGRCWAKGTRSVMLDTALKDCTESIELSSSTVAALDSRAMVWYRMGRYEEALRDLDAALAQAPGEAQSRFLRAIVLERLHRDADAARELQVARRISPAVDKTYARYGIKP
jgi:tetratricopeptide (TPR) repeat protein/transglutaminase-like putative cysteine protease